MRDWQAIVRQHGPLVWKTAYRLLAHEADASDCFQETFISAMEVAEREEVRSWPALLQRLATARALDCLRRRLREAGRCNLSGDWDQVPADGIDPPHQAQAMELGDRLRVALGELPYQQSEVFCLRHLNELSYEEIAAQLKISVSAVGVLLHRGRGRLRELLASVCSSEGDSR